MSKSAAFCKIIRFPAKNSFDKNSHEDLLHPLQSNDAFNKRPVPQYIESQTLLKAMQSLHHHPHINRLLEDLWHKDPDTYHHCHRVADLAQSLAGQLGMTSQERVEVYLSGLLHDIGKLFTPDSILKKPGPLTQEEFSIMRLHPEDSEKIVSTISDIGYLTPGIRFHHERIDGKGYPNALQGDAVPMISRIVLVADTFDAMMNNRVYRRKLNIEETYNELTRCSGSQFDTDVVKGFIAMHQKIAPQITPSTVDTQTNESTIESSEASSSKSDKDSQKNKKLSA